VPDPHAWQDLRNGAAYVRNIAAGLRAADPAGGAIYERNAGAYLARIEAEDGRVREAIARVPPQKRRVVTSHDAFGYFGAAYGVELLAPEGISDDAEPSAQAIRLLIDQIRRERIKVLFLENALSPKLVEQIARETGARVGGTLYADALSPPGGPADTYLGMFEHNVPLLVEAMLAGGES
jgi:zinc/manganese transport system substrate-binding protein